MRPPRTQTNRVLRVEFEDGCESRSAIGGGETMAEAIAFARDSLPEGRRWRTVSWRDLYGD